MKLLSFVEGQGHLSTYIKKISLTYIHQSTQMINEGNVKLFSVLTCVASVV